MAHHSPSRSSTFPFADHSHALAHPQAPLHLLRAHVARAPGPGSSPLSICSSTCTTPSSAESASPIIQRGLARIQTTSLVSSPTSALAPTLPDTTAHPSAPVPKSRPVRTSTLSVFSGASGITIIGGSITNAGGNIFSRRRTFPSYCGDVADEKKVKEIEDSENSWDAHVEVTAFENVTGLKAYGATIVNAGGDVLSAIDGSSPKDQNYDVHTHMFTGAKNAHLENVEVVDAAGNVVYVGDE